MACGDSTHSTPLMRSVTSVKEFPSKYIDSVLVFSHISILLMCKYRYQKRALKIENETKVEKSKPTQPYLSA